MTLASRRRVRARRRAAEFQAQRLAELSALTIEDWERGVLLHSPDLPAEHVRACAEVLRDFSIRWASGKPIYDGTNLGACP